MFEQQIKAHALETPAKEVCGLVMRDQAGALVVHRMANTSPKPDEFFRLDPAEFHRQLQTGRVVAYYHSHPGTHEPSGYDLDTMEAVGLPMLVYGVQDDILAARKPKAWHQRPLEGRPFVPMVDDCISLVVDYFQEVLDITLPDIPRTQRDYYRGASCDVRALLEATGVRIVATPQPNDILALCVYGSRRINHLAVYIGDGYILHQTGEAASRVDLLAGYWDRFVTFTLRHPQAQDKPAWKR